MRPSWCQGAAEHIPIQQEQHWWFLWLRYELFHGSLTDAAFQISELILIELLRPRASAKVLAAGS
jgi:hypothetical protein